MALWQHYVPGFTFVVCVDAVTAFKNKHLWMWIWPCVYAHAHCNTASIFSPVEFIQHVTCVTFLFSGSCQLQASPCVGIVSAAYLLHQYSLNSKPKRKIEAWENLLHTYTYMQIWKWLYLNMCIIGKCCTTPEMERQKLQCWPAGCRTSLGCM